MRMDDIKDALSDIIYQQEQSLKDGKLTWKECEIVGNILFWEMTRLVKLYKEANNKSLTE